MNPVVDRVARWRDEDKQVALATVVKVERSGPLGPGTSMAVSEDGQVVGSVSGGCVEPAVFEEAMDAIEGGRPRLLRSEEHTSELQSRQYLVCRLLLEKKK